MTDFDINRRSLMWAMPLATAAIGGLIGAAQAQTAAPKAMVYAVKPLPFDPQKIKGMSEKILLSHYQNNYTGAVKRLNSIADQLASLDYEKAPVFLINGLKREELIATNSMILHEVYFSGLGEANQPGAALAEAIARDFGSMDRWRSEFAAMGRAEGGGSGWVLLTYSPRDKRLMNAWATDYVSTLMGAIDWTHAGREYARASRD